MAGDVLFNNIPATGLTAPIVTFEVNSGGQYDAPDRVIIQGHKTPAGTIALNKPTAVYDQDTVDRLAGPGSMLREMFRIAQQNAPALPIYIEAVGENGIAPVWTYTVGVLPNIGVGTVEICKERIDIAVQATDTPATVASALAGAIGSYYNTLTGAMLPVTATAAGNVVTVTGRHASAIMNEVDFHAPTMLANNLFAKPGVLTLAQTQQGAGTPLLSAALNALGDDPKDFIISPWSDGASLSAFGSLTSDLNGSWSWLKQTYGHVWTVGTGGFSALTTLGLSLNDRHTSIIQRVPSVPSFGTKAYTAQPVAGQTDTFGTTTVTFVAANPTGNQVLIGANLGATLANLLAFLQGSADTSIAQASYALSGSTLQITANVSGSGGNGFSIASTVGGVALSGLTLAGGANGCPEPSWLWAAGVCARVAPWLSDCDTGNVSRNQTGLVVQGLHPPRDRTLAPGYAGRNVLNQSGISTWHVGADGSVQIDKLVTTYKVGQSGQPDAVFRDVQAVYQVSGGLKYLRALLAQEHGNKAIADVNPGSLGAISTPADIKATFVHGYSELVNNGVFEDLNTYSKTLRVTRDKQNRARVNVYNPMQRVSPLDVLAANATIYQRFPDAA
jgi:phage tail sheath gpL-like